MHTYYVFVWATFSCSVQHTVHILCNLLCATHKIAMHGVVTHVAATQGTHLRKYLTIPYHKNSLKQFFSWPQWINMHHLDSLLIPPTLKTVFNVLRIFQYFNESFQC